MIIYYSMLLFALLAVSFYTQKTQIAGDFRIANESQKVSWLGAFLIWAYIIFWVAMRSRFVDTPAYIHGFQTADDSWRGLIVEVQGGGKAPGWGAFNVLFKMLISSNYHIFFLGVALIQAIPIMNTLRKYSENYFYSVFLFIAALRFTEFMNGIRQFVAVAVLFGCTKWIIERKWFPYCLIVLLMSTIHFTAIIMIPIYWCVTCKPWHWKMLLVMAGCLFVGGFTSQFTSGLENILTYTAYANATDQFANDDGVHPLRVILFFVPVLLSFIFRKKLKEANDPQIDLCVNMSIIACGLYFIGMFTSGILVGRLPIYCELYNFILYPYIFNHCFTPPSRSIMYGACTLCYLVFFIIMSKGFYYYSDILGFWG